MAHVVVTGATGFIGSALIRQMLAEKRRVIAVIEPNADETNLEGLDVERVTADVNDFEVFRKVLSGAEAFHHLAAIYKLWLPNPEIIYRVNVEGTTTVLLAAMQAKVPRVVYTSSVAAIGIREGAPSDETVPFNMFSFANEYLLTKYLSERVAVRFAQSGLPVTIVNPGFPFGERDRAPTPTGKILLGLLRQNAPGYSKGGFNAVDVEVVAKGHLLAEAKGRVGERYVLGDHNISFKDFFKMVCEIANVPFPDREIPVSIALAIGFAMEKVSDHITHKSPQMTMKGLQYGTRDCYFDVSKARNELGLPSVPLRDTIERAIAWYKANGFAEPRGRKKKNGAADHTAARRA